MAMGALVAVASRPSRARAVSVCAPGAAPFQIVENGAVASIPRLTPSAKNSTLLTLPSGSLAFAEIVIGCPTPMVAPLAGEAMEMLGGRFVEAAPPGEGADAVQLTGSLA